MLLLKLLLVPGLLIAVTLVSRRWGPMIGGALAGMPWVVGPILLVVIIEQGPQFAIEAAWTSFLVVPSSAINLTVFAHAIHRFSLPVSIVLALISWFISASLLLLLPHSVALIVVINLAALMVLPFVLPTLRRLPSGCKRHVARCWRARWAVPA